MKSSDPTSSLYPGITFSITAQVIIIYNKFAGCVCLLVCADDVLANSRRPLIYYWRALMDAYICVLFNLPVVFVHQSTVGSDVTYI